MVIASSSHPIASASSVPINPHAGAAERYTMPQLLVVRTGRGKSATTTLPNVDAVAAALERPALYLVRHFQYSLSIQVGAGAQLSGNVDADRLESLLREFINTWVLCQSSQCRLPECELVVEAPSSPILLYCAACGHVAELRRGVLTKQSKLVKFIRANPPTMGLGGTRPISGGRRAPSQHRQTREPHRQRSGLPVMVQLQTEGAFESHCRRLGRWIDIDPLQDSRAARTWLNCPPASTGRTSTGAERLAEHDLPGELLMSIFRRLSAKDRYRCMQCCVGWLMGGMRAMEDGRRERREAVADGRIVGSSSDESDPTDSSSSSDSEEDIERQPRIAELDASIEISDVRQRERAPEEE